jgi:hypothetical protein
MKNKKISRSSKTGKFVTAKYAAKHKATTESEKIAPRKSIIKFLVIGDPGRKQIDLVLQYYNEEEGVLYKILESGRLNRFSPTVFDSLQKARTAIIKTKRHICENGLDWKGNYKVIPIEVNI